MTTKSQPKQRLCAVDGTPLKKTQKMYCSVTCGNRAKAAARSKKPVAKKIKVSETTASVPKVEGLSAKEAAANLSKASKEIAEASGVSVKETAEKRKANAIAKAKTAAERPRSLRTILDDDDTRSYAFGFPYRVAVRVPVNIIEQTVTQNNNKLVEGTAISERSEENVVVEPFLKFFKRHRVVEKTFILVQLDSSGEMKEYEEAKVYRLKEV